MHFSQRLTALVVALDFASSAAGMSHPRPRNFDEKKHVDLGSMNSLDDFYDYLGTTHEDWEDVKQDPTSVAARSYHQGRDAVSSSDVAVTVFADEQCGDRTNPDGQVCQQTPNYAPYFIAATAVAGGALVFSGNIANQFMRGWANFQLEGGWSTTRRVNIMQGSPVLKRDEWEDKLVRFTVARDVDTGLMARGVDEDGLISEARSFGHYAYNSKSGMLTHESETHRFTKDDTALRRRGLTARQDNVFSMEIEDYRVSNTVTISSESCLTSLIDGYIHRTLANGRVSCQPAADGASPWITLVGIYVNPGSDNWERVTECCP